MRHYPRNLTGYGANQPEARWPNHAKIAVQFVVNYEEGGENNILHGDAASEAFLSEIVGAAAWPNQRHWNMESIYEYGARPGFWRLHKLFTTANIPVTVFGVATALARAPLQVKAMQDAGWDIASHGLKWIDYKDHSREDEKADILEAVALHETVTGKKPTGWYTGRCSVNTVGLVAEAGGFSWQSDCYDDDLPHWVETDAGPQLMIPYTLDANDMRFATAQGFNTGDDFYRYLKDSFDCLYEEGLNGAPKMMSIGLHCRLIGRPGRVQALKKFISYVQSHEDVWCATREQIAAHWHNTHPYQPQLRPSQLREDQFLALFGGVFEHSPWIAEAAFADEQGLTTDSCDAFHQLLCRHFRSATYEKRLGVLNAHPDLAGKLAAAKRLTAESTAEQASAGLDALTDDEKATFEALNHSYRDKFGHPFIIAVKGLTKADILSAFHHRLDLSPESEFEEACHQVEKIAQLRLVDIFATPLD